MSIPISSILEVIEALRNVSLVRVNFKKSKNWGVFPIHGVSDDSVDILIKLKDNNIQANENDIVILKFQSNGYEFHIEAKIKSVTDFDLVVVTFVGFEGIKYLNIRKHIRFDIQLKSKIIIENKEIEAIVKNISMGGALICTNELELGNYYNIKIYFDTEDFYSKMKILRKVNLDGNFEYGVKFEELTKENSNILSRQILIHEKKCFDTIKTIRGDSSNDYDKKIYILNYNKFENVDTRDALKKIGAGTYEVLYNFKYYVSFFEEEKPEILIIDTEMVNENIINLITNVKENFKNVSIFMLLPYEKETECSSDELFNEIKLLYRPLVENEFEDAIIKYL